MKPSEGSQYRRGGIMWERNRWLKALNDITNDSPDMDKFARLLLAKVIMDSVEEYAEWAKRP